MLLDCDPGIDDAMAMIFALKSNKVEMEGITTVSGNIGIDLATNNALRILELTGNAHIPVAKGIAKPLINRFEVTSGVHGIDGMGNANLPRPKIKKQPIHAVNFIINTIMNAPNEITLVSVGPLTNIAVAITLEPRIIENVRETIIMGGAVTVAGNITCEAEFNIHSDPESARIVFNSGLPITLVGLDVTMKTLLKEEHLDQILEANTPVTRFLEKIVKHYMRFYKEIVKVDGCGLHDPLAVGVAIDRTLVRTRPIFVDVETKGEITYGETVGDLRLGSEGVRNPPNMNVCVDVDSTRFLEMFINTLKC